jgi:hypothetical protein
MWNCKKCKETIEDNFEICWNCRTTKEGEEEDPNFGDKSEFISKEEQEKNNLVRSIECLRCKNELKYLGRKSFHEGKKWGFWLGDLGELFVNREHFETYACPKCGHIEFFIAGLSS